ncbi:MAG TPA: DUF371 domain-containing protein [Nitrososphaera sp.]
MVQDEVTFYGHPNVRSLHSKSIEITKDGYLTPKGDCIIGIKANKACTDLEESIRRGLKSSSAIVKIEVIVGDKSFIIKGRGDERLTMLNPQDIVIRRTNFVCPRTMSVLCDKASSDMPRELVRLLQHQEQKGIFRITIE